MTTSEIGLLDTNVLVYAADETSPFHPTAKVIREKGLKGEISLYICPQVLTEFFAIVTDSKRVSHPRTQEEAQIEIAKYIHSENGHDPKRVTNNHENPPHPNPPPRGGRGREGVIMVFSKQNF